MLLNNNGNEVIVPKGLSRSAEEAALAPLREVHDHLPRHNGKQFAIGTVAHQPIPQKVR